MSNTYTMALGYLVTIRGLAAQLRLNSRLGKTNGVEATKFLGPQIRQYIDAAESAVERLFDDGLALETEHLALMLELCLNIKCDLKFVDKDAEKPLYPRYTAILDQICGRIESHWKGMGA